MIDTRKLDQFIVREYGPDYDCADLAIDVARELFGREIALPQMRPPMDRSEPRFMAHRNGARHPMDADARPIARRRGASNPMDRPRPQGKRGQALALRRAMGELAKPVDVPADGDLVLMRLKGTEIAGHIGTYLHVAHEPHVLHTSLAMGFAALHKIRDLARYGLQLEGYYRWVE